MANVKKRRHFLSEEKQKDQFYTNKDLARKLVQRIVDKLPYDKKRIFLEPSAGDGSFLIPMRHHTQSIGIDIDPKHSWVIERDFLKSSAKDLELPEPRHVVVVGNPPFGFAANVAIKFFNHAAMMANTIAFIVPKTFQKKSVQAKLDLNFHLISEWGVPKNAFIFQGQDYDVPCIFQIWQRRNSKRRIFKMQEPKYIIFTTPEDAQFTIRRVGGRAGQTGEVKGSHKGSNYYVKTKNGYSVPRLRRMIDALDFSKEKNATAGVRSISKKELICRMNKGKINEV